MNTTFDLYFVLQECKRMNLLMYAVEYNNKAQDIGGNRKIDS